VNNVPRVAPSGGTAGNRTRNLSITNLTPYHYTTIHQAVEYDSVISLMRPAKTSDCRVCCLCFAIDSGLDKHMSKIHLGIRPFICDKCGISYGDEPELRMHIARHAENKPHSCNLCSYSTFQKGSLKCQCTYSALFISLINLLGDRHHVSWLVSV